MIEYIKGELAELTPADAVVECCGIGYHILISLQTFSQLENKKDVKVYIHHYLREDEELYYGFGTREERELFRLLIISVYIILFKLLMRKMHFIFFLFYHALSLHHSFKLKVTELIYLGFHSSLKTNLL